MLAAPYTWNDNPEMCLLMFNQGTVAVLELIDGRISCRLNWHGGQFTFRAGSYEQGRRWVERWIKARGNDIPFAHKLRRR